MNLFDTIAVLVTLSAFLGYVNYRFIRLPATIALMLMALVLALAVTACHPWLSAPFQYAQLLVSGIDFNETLLHGMLSFLLFAGALHVDLADLYHHRFIIGILATIGVIGSTFITGLLTFYLLALFGHEVPMMHCLLFGALISPTDPIAAMGILKKAGVAREMETIITGESLFNDGVAVVVFLVLLQITAGGGDISGSKIALLFFTEAGGGVLIGFLIGALAYAMLKSIDNYQVEILITLAVVTGGFALADVLHTSGPIAMVIAGLMIGNQGRMWAMSDLTRRHLDAFWELIDEFLNAVLFVLIGFEVLAFTFNAGYIAAGLAIIPVVLTTRLICAGLPGWALRSFRRFHPHLTKVLTWGGLRGGISVALALALPPSPHRDLLLAMAYTVVVFSIIVQGLTVKPLVNRLGVGKGKPAVGA